MAKWTIRRADPADAAALTACIDAAYAKYAGRVTDLPDVSEGIANDIRDHMVWVALAGDRIVGGLVLVIKEDQAVLANVAVDPIASGSGLGRALIDRAETETRQSGLNVLKLTTHAAIPENIGLYKHFGWRETGRKGNKVFMEKNL
ncbi:MAG: GNAT family N-acetyltransferase [Hyphomicrobiaceae bacterium]